MRGLAEEGKEVLEQSGAGFPDDARKLLKTVVETLSAVNPTLPFPSAIPLITKLSSAADLILSSSPSAPPIYLLPAELFSRIVYFCQDDNVRLRQYTNRARAHTSQAFYLAVRPILAAEAHVYTPWQLMRLAIRRERDKTAAQALRRLSIVLAPVEIQRRGVIWPGRSWPKLHGCLGEGGGKLQELSLQ